MTRPGTRLRGICARWCGADTMARLVDPIVTDLRLEHAAAARRGPWAARRALAIGYLAFAKALAIHGCRAYGRAIATASTGDWWRTVRAPLVAIAITTIVLAAPPWIAAARIIGTRRVSWVFWLLPQSLAVTLPLGLAIGLLVGSARQRSAALISAMVLGVSLASFANLAWLLPTANQAFRVSAAAPWLAGRPLARGVNELTLGELRSLLEPGTHEPMAVAQPATRAGIAVAYYERWALTFTTIVLGLFVSAIRARESSRLSIATGLAAVSLGYYTLTYIGHTFAWQGTWPAVVGAWFPNGAMVATTVVLMIARESRAENRCG